LTLAEKLRHLRALEGQMRGLERPLTKAELVRCMQAELGEGLSAAYLSQLECGRRAHLTLSTRALLARFFKVHPGYLVSDPVGFERTIGTQALQERPSLREWLRARAAEWADDTVVADLFSRLAASHDPRRALILVSELLAQFEEEVGDLLPQGAANAEALASERRTVALT